MPPRATEPPTPGTAGSAVGRSRPPTGAALSAVLDRFMDGDLLDGAPTLTVGRLVAELGDASAGAMLLVLALPAIPMPPIFAALLGAPLLLVSLQMLIGRPHPWLPGAFKRLGLGAPAAARLITRLRPQVVRLEAVVRPRGASLFNPVHSRFVALGCTALSIVLLTPAPFAHTAAALGIVAFAVGLIQRDGLALMAGWALTLGCAALMALITGGAIAAARLL
jgi:hypothetical protein